MFHGRFEKEVMSRVSHNYATFCSGPSRPRPDTILSRVKETWISDIYLLLGALKEDVAISQGKRAAGTVRVRLLCYQSSGLQLRAFSRFSVQDPNQTPNQRLNPQLSEESSHLAITRSKTIPKSHRLPTSSRNSRADPTGKQVRE